MSSLSPLDRNTIWLPHFRTDRSEKQQYRHHQHHHRVDHLETTKEDRRPIAIKQTAHGASLTTSSSSTSAFTSSPADQSPPDSRRDSSSDSDFGYSSGAASSRSSSLSGSEASPNQAFVLDAEHSRELSNLFRQRASTPSSTASSETPFKSCSPSPTSGSTVYLTGGKVVTIDTDLAQRHRLNPRGSLASLCVPDSHSRNPSVKSNLAWGAIADPRRSSHQYSSPSLPSSGLYTLQSASHSRQSLGSLPTDKLYSAAHFPSPLGFHSALTQSMIELSAPIASGRRIRRTSEVPVTDEGPTSFEAVKEECETPATEYFDAGSNPSSPKILQAPAEIGTFGAFAPSTPSREALSPSEVPHHAPNPDADFDGRFANTSAGLPSPARAGFRFANATPISTPLHSISSPRSPIALVTARTLDFESGRPSPSNATGLLPAFGDAAPTSLASVTSPLRRSIVQMGSAEMGESWGRRQSLRDRPLEFPAWAAAAVPVAAPGEAGTPSRGLTEAMNGHSSRTSAPSGRSRVTSPVSFQPLSDVIALGEGLAGGPQRDDKGRKINLKNWRRNDPLAEAGGVGNVFVLGVGDAKESGGYRQRFSRSVTNFFAPAEKGAPGDGPKKPTTKRFTNLKSLSVTNLLMGPSGGRPRTPERSAGDRARDLFDIDVTDSPTSSRSPPPDVPERTSSHRNSAFLRRRARLQPIDSAKSKLPYSHSMPSLHEYSDYQRGSKDKVQTWLSASPVRTPVEEEPEVLNGGVPLAPLTPPKVMVGAAAPPVPHKEAKSPSVTRAPIRPAVPATPSRRSSWTNLIKKSILPSSSTVASKPGHGRTVSSSAIPDSTEGGQRGRSASGRPRQHVRAVSSSTLASDKASKPSLLYRLRNPSVTSLLNRPTLAPEKEPAPEKELPPIPAESFNRKSKGLNWLQPKGIRSSTALANGPAPSPKQLSSLGSTSRSTTPPSELHSQLPSLEEVEDEDEYLAPPRRFIEVNLDSGMFSVEELLLEVDNAGARDVPPVDTQAALRTARASLDSNATSITGTSISGASYDVGDIAIGHVLAAPFISGERRQSVILPSGSAALLAFPTPPERSEEGAGMMSPMEDGLRTPRARTVKRRDSVGM